jgi:thymidine kinase
VGLTRHSFDDEIVKICNDLANQGIRVIVAGLDMDS